MEENSEKLDGMMLCPKCKKMTCALFFKLDKQESLDENKVSGSCDCSVCGTHILFTIA